MRVRGCRSDKENLHKIIIAHRTLRNIQQDNEPAGHKIRVGDTISEGYHILTARNKPTHNPLRGRLHKKLSPKTLEQQNELLQHVGGTLPMFLPA